MDGANESDESLSKFGFVSTDTLDDHCTCYDAATANADLAKMIDEMGLPNSVTQLGTCITCQTVLDKTSAKAFGLRLNAKAIGNFFIEVLCPKCSSGYELHYEQVCTDFDGFIKFLVSGPFDLKPVNSVKIPFWKNNLLEKVLREKERKK